MICAELERLEAQFDDILTALEDEHLTEQQKQELKEAYERMSRVIKEHHEHGHAGGPCFEGGEIE